MKLLQERERLGASPAPAPTAVEGKASWWRDMLAGGLLALVVFAYSVSFGALIFSGRLSGYMSTGVLLALASAAVATVIVSRLGSFRYAIGGPDMPIVAILSALAMTMAAQTAADAPPGQVLSNAVGALALASLATAAVLLGIGILRLGLWVRFIPFPVVAGFLAASGWFLVNGGIAMTTGLPLTALAAAPAPHLGPGSPLAAALAFAVLLAGLRWLTRSDLVAPVTLMAGWLGLDLLMLAGLLDAGTLRAGGWLFPELPEGATVLPLTQILEVPPQAQVLLTGLPEILSVAGIAALAVLLNATGLEVDSRTDADLDRDYVASGLANLALVPLGGLPSNLSLNRSTMHHRAGARSAVAGLGVALGCGLLALGSGVAVDAMPAPLLGGLVLYMGATMLWRWLYGSARKFTRGEHLMVGAIFLLIVVLGYIAGAVLGVVASCMTFAFTYSRIPFVRQRLTRAQYASYVERPREAEALLRSHGGRIRIFRLQGYIFFGTAHQLEQEVKRMLAGAAEPVSTVLLDFRDVTGADSSASLSLAKILQFLDGRGVRACVTGLTHAQTRRQIDLASAGAGVPAPTAFDRLELGLEWCEDRLLADLGGRDRRGRGFDDWLGEEMGGTGLAGRLIAAMERREVATGEMICRQGEPADSIVFVSGGRVSIMLERAGEPPLRLRTMLGRTVIGEIGFYRGQPRGASVVADAPSEVFVLTRDVFETLRVTDPGLLDALHRLIVRVLADRLTFANNEIAALHR